ncbi:MAG: DUF402 domain-containing protein [Mollicutes bacterium]|nr:DUF402 domain-containing protein [Mollicutes bacterium]
MRKRLVTQKYLRDTIKYNLKVFISDDKGYYVAVKEIIEVEKPFILSNGLLLMDSGYYIVEVIPKNENYAMRVFFNEKKELVEHYFDISLGNGIDEETKLPYYDDVFLDVTITNGQIEICDEDELDNALSQGEITKETYNFAKEVANKLIEEINSNTNKYVNMNLGEYLK